MKQRILTFGQYLAQFFALLRIVRAPLVVAILVVIALILPSQTLELYRALLEDWPNDFARIAGAGLLAVAASFLFYASTRAVIVLSRKRVEDGGILVERLPTVVAFAVASAPLLGLTGGLFNTYLHHRLDAGEAAVPAVEALRDRLLMGSLVATAIWVAVMAGLWWLFVARPRRDEPVLSHIFSPRTAVYCLLALLGIGVVGTLYNQTLSPMLGAVVIFFVFSLFLMYLASYASLAFNRYGWPALIFLAIWAGFCAYFNNNRAIRTTGVPPLKAAPNLQVSFLDWYSARADFNRHLEERRPYPVYVVAAHGGGIYAAYHSALFLSRLQDVCPRFAQHTFAISAVSGGSLGAALFTGLTQRFAAEQSHASCSPRGTGEKRFEKLVLRYLSNDFLSPVLFAMLFPDALQKVIPSGIGALDRSWDFEKSLEAAWARVIPDDQPNFFRLSLRDTWSPRAAMPALVMNATSVESGRIVMAAPFEIYVGEIPPDGNYLGARVDLPVNSVVSISARFPGISPPARHQPAEGPPIDLVDGGYFDNSGVTSAHGLVSSLMQEFERKFLAFHELRKKELEKEPLTEKEVKNAQITDSSSRTYNVTLVDRDKNLFRLTALDPGAPRLPDFQFKLVVIQSFSAKPHRQSQDLGPYLRAALALAATRQERARLSVRRALRDLCRARAACRPVTWSLDDTVRFSLLDHDEYPLPLGWSMSKIAANYIGMQIGIDKNCVEKDGSDIYVPSKQRNDCIYGLFRKELDG